MGAPAVVEEGSCFCNPVFPLVYLAGRALPVALICVSRDWSQASSKAHKAAVMSRRPLSEHPGTQEHDVPLPVPTPSSSTARSGSDKQPRKPKPRGNAELPAQPYRPLSRSPRPRRPALPLPMHRQTRSLSNRMTQEGIWSCRGPQRQGTPPATTHQHTRSHAGVQGPMATVLRCGGRCWTCGVPPRRD